MAATDGGVLHAIYLAGGDTNTRSSIVQECVAAAIHLKAVMRPSYPMAVTANKRAMDAIEAHHTHRASSPWQHRTVLKRTRTASARTIAPYVFKLRALLASRFERTVFCDCDLVVLKPILIHSLLTSVLEVADVSMPLDPGRAPHLTVEHPPWASSIGPPPLCSAIMAYRHNDQSTALFQGALARLEHGVHSNVRQGDQEMIWFQWTRGPESRGIRMLALPEETYCPLEARQKPKVGSWLSSSRWTTSWRRGSYGCAAVHGHAYMPDLWRSLNRNRTR